MKIINITRTHLTLWQAGHLAPAQGIVQPVIEETERISVGAAQHKDECDRRY